MIHENHVPSVDSVEGPLKIEHATSRRGAAFALPVSAGVAQAHRITRSTPSHGAALAPLHITVSP